MNKLPGYRADIDGLRAVAITSVVGFHAYPAWFPGGFIGVDVFFVISGFLISTIIFDGLKRGSFDYVDFYVRRIKRIFPALIVILVATVVAGALITFPDEFRQLGKHVFGGAMFLSNVLLARGAGYFEAGSDQNPLLHLWSLGVEEQFYLIWPVTAAVLYLRAGQLRVALPVLLAASLIASLFFSARDPVFAFYSPLTRFWELMAGAMLAYSAVFRPRPLSGQGTPPAAWRNDVVATLGAIFVGTAILLFGREDIYPGWRALLPTLGAALLIAAGPAAWVNSKVLAQPGIVFIGLISYPLYLWHWPILSFIRIAYGDVGATSRLIAVAASVLLAWLTYRFVEQPVRFGSGRRLAPLALSGMVAALAAFGLAARFGLIDTGSFTERAAYVSHFENSEPEYRYIVNNGIESAYRLDCDFYDFLKRRPRQSISRSCFTRDTPRAVMIWGDSHAQSLYHGLREALPPEIGVLQVATSACRPSVLPMTPDPWGICNQANRYALGVIRKTKPDVVVLAQSQLHENTNWDDLANELLAAGARHVLLVGPVPQWNWDLHKIVARDYWESPPRRIGARLREATFATDARLKASRRPGSPYHFISLIDNLCDTKGCLAFVGPDRVEDIMAFDSGHMTQPGSEFVGRELLAPAITAWLAALPQRPGLAASGR